MNVEQVHDIDAAIYLLHAAETLDTPSEPTPIPAPVTTPVTVPVVTPEVPVVPPPAPATPPAPIAPIVIAPPPSNISQLPRAGTSAAPASQPVAVPQGLARIQRWLGRSNGRGGVAPNTLGVYAGIYTSGWRAPQFEQNLAIPFAAEGIDYACIKFGEYGALWYDDTTDAIKDAFHKHGVGMAPYYFCRPDTGPRDAQICGVLAQKCGGVILDCEEHWAGRGGQLYALVHTVRQMAPDACIIVSGYGDPMTMFGFGWDFSAIREADGYQPQWYVGYWDPYKQHGWQYALNWADQQCNQAFQHFGLGSNFAIQPAINVEGVNLGDLEPMGQFLLNWKASLCVWEAHDLTVPEIQALRRGLGR